MKLILQRHGESAWNKKNLFTGWVDIPLSEKGMEEAIAGGKKFQDIPIDVVFVSTLIRSKQTAALSMLHHSSQKVLAFVPPPRTKLNRWAKIYSPKAQEEVIFAYSSWCLNERMYGKLQGLNKDETREKFGEEQVKIWRRSYDTAPPSGESLKMTAGRTIPFFRKNILPQLKKGKNVLISAHGYSLRSIVMFLDDLSGEEVSKLEIPTGDPIMYAYQHGKFHRL